ncbi:hypothetical protein T440DRAFT_519600 [Plenodomus tracheiphilus IPT5]|uniref:Uncharacterized protein n=1 Tax=Plenodomus tracheiphilus IPT5 TaxID=1408161 RepID=A0A6A7B3W3_9PLEO|nr:hypothetical protein T440DRAFT_519600 [Plenodomus tracheiphilus IPT5]
MVMDRAPGVAEYLSDVLDEYRNHIQQRQDDEQSIDKPFPSLTHNVLPMFSDRWCGGPDQHTSEFYHCMEPALQLTSFLFDEDYPLLWFCHLTFGERRRDDQGVYIVPTAYSRSPEALIRVRENLKEMGKVISFAFMPRDWPDSAWGITFTSRKYHPDRFRRFKDHDFPPAQSRLGRARPVVTIASKFQHYFRRVYSTATTPSERYRALFMFAVTIGHETAHAYEMWLTGGTEREEPRWCKRDKIHEIGFAWETYIIGGVSDPTQSSTSREMFPYLCSLHLEDYSTLADRDVFVRKYKGESSAEWTTRDVGGMHRQWAALLPSEFRGGTWFLSPDATAFLASVQVIPLKWVMQWFREDNMVRRKAEWSHAGYYKQAPMPDTFTIIYERNTKGIHIQRPLNPYFPVDREIMRQRRKTQENAGQQAT